MTQEQHPITPPDGLVRQWLGNFFGSTVTGELGGSERYLATQAARWGADQELEACCEWLPSDLTINGESLRDVRRPKPPSLKEQALEDFDGLMSELDGAGNYSNCAERIRRALEALPDD